MKATGLMVGDWVSVSGKPVKITKDDLATMLIFLDDDSKIDPIPLTEDILVKNGLRKHTMLYKNEWYGDIGLFEEHGKFYYMDLKIEYIHQLQHLLRLCGIEKEIEL